jgi:hypothetical protein
MGASGVDRQVILFSGVVAGTLGQWGFSGLQDGNFSFLGLIPGLIASIVTFPFIYENAGLNKVKVNFVKWCVAFQNGFFWPVLLEQVGKGFGAQ